ncbi:hypothetical protein DH2020_045919 [Rehmannia glutinosa]|uniref:Trichome birefringence-like N-terminal domain-containing protein n=1 Tax=Rehmannia glutinosa TaxID=99300 RepID=A0ABR0UD70_REHGL
MNCPALCVAAALVTAAALYLKSDNRDILEEKQGRKKEQNLTRNEEYKKGNDSVSRCDFFSGRWVYDNISYPLYKEGKCSFMLNDYGCEKYGRKDLKYQQWRWQPHDCDIPRFNGTTLLEKIRGKKLVFVGDSLNKNQWTSMLCLIESSVHQSTPKLVIKEGNMFTFQATEYNATIGFYWSPLLVESNCDDPDKHSVRDRVIRITSIEKHARHWTDADILVFDSFMWWLEPTMTLLWGSFGSSDAIYKRVEMRLRRYEMALNTWGERWDVQQNCYNETDPIFKEGWVYDNVSYPLYKERQCSFMEYDFACEMYGRKDLKYQNWRWQPHHCDLPRFNGTALLEKIRGKKLVFVGDSLIRNQWRSMLCLIESYLPETSKKSVKFKGNFCYFQAIEYNATIGFYWAPMLVESNGDNIHRHGHESRVVGIKSIEKHGRHWSDADILVFDSFVWWMSRQIMTVLWGSFGSPDAIQKRVEDKLRPYEIALGTWSNWLEMHINRTKTKLFFMSPTPYHPGGTMWGTHHKCYKETEPVSEEKYWASAMNHDMMRITESAIDKLEQRGLKVEYLNITELSAYREDAHPSIYRVFWRILTKDELKDLTKYADCLHWCLPGVDVWNQILYAYIMKS